MNPFAAIVAAAVIAAVVSLPVSVLVLRLSGGYFAVATLVIAAVFQIAATPENPVAVRLHRLTATGRAVPVEPGPAEPGPAEPGPGSPALAAWVPAGFIRGLRLRG